MQDFRTVFRKKEMYSSQIYHRKSEYMLYNSL